jgi:ParB family chromosome partitioning protein
MNPSRILIVEPDHSFGLSLASLFQDDGLTTRVARSAGEAELEIAVRRPDLVVLRAELPDLSGFSLCARLRHDRATARIPVILYSSDTAPGALAEHASTPWAANGYLAMPLDTSALRSLSKRILSANDVVESADDAVIEEAEPAASPFPGPKPPTLPAFPAASPSAHTPPPMRKRAVRNALTQEDRLLVDRIFGSIAERRDALLAEANVRRPPPRRDLLQTADGRLQLLREDIKSREAQIAQLAELWEVREREVEYAGEWLHEKDVELQGLKGKVEDLQGRLAEAREVLVQKEREHGASVDGLLLEKVTQEKQLIESVASAERRLHEAERNHGAVKRSLEEAVEALEATRRSLEERLGSVEAELAAERARAVTLDGELAAEREGAEAASADANRRAEELSADVAERDRLLAAARRENERLQGELTSARHEQMVLQSEVHAAGDRAAAREQELAELLAIAQKERDEARAAAAPPVADASAAAPGAGAVEPRGEAGDGGAAPAGDAVHPEAGQG